MNNVILIGRLVADPKMRHLQTSNRSVCDFRLAIDKQLSREKKEQFEAQGKPTADFIRVITWDKQAEICNAYLKKGVKVAVVGSIATSKMTDDSGNTKYFTDVVARNIEFLERVEAEKTATQPTEDDYIPYDDPAGMPF